MSWSRTLLSISHSLKPVVAPQPTWTISQRFRVTRREREQKRLQAEQIKTQEALAPKIVVEPVPKVKIRREWTIRERGLHRFDGDRVQLGDVLCRQFKVDYHPGQHVRMGYDRTLYALEPGRIMITSEVIDPDWNNEHVKEAYHKRQGHLIFRKHVHVIPDPLPKKFKLVSLV